MSNRISLKIVCDFGSVLSHRCTCNSSDKFDFNEPFDAIKKGDTSWQTAIPVHDCIHPPVTAPQALNAIISAQILNILDAFLIFLYVHVKFFLISYRMWFQALHPCSSRSWWACTTTPSWPGSCGIFSTLFKIPCLGVSVLSMRTGQVLSSN